MKTWMVAGLVSALSCSTAMGEAMTYGLGTTTCGLYVTAAEEARAGQPYGVLMYMSWFSGYATMASGQSNIDYFKGTDTKSVQLWLENYCRANPLSTFNAAAVSAMVELHKKQTQ